MVLKVWVPSGSILIEFKLTEMLIIRSPPPPGPRPAGLETQCVLCQALSVTLVPANAPSHCLE